MILLKDNVPFLVCPLCGQNVLAREAIERLDAVCAEPKLTNALIAQCLEIEREHGAELPLQVVLKLCEKFPQNETVAFMAVTLSDFNPSIVHQYLVAFSDDAREIPFAVDFLEGALKFRNLRHASLFRAYITNKLKGNIRTRWLENLDDMSSSFVGKELKGASLISLYIIYFVSIALNVGVTIMLLLLQLDFLINVLIGGLVLCVEIVLIYVHNRQAGHRSLIGDFERGLMVTFLCSLAVIVGASLVAGLINF
jgi:hypothetical protein